VTQAVATSKSHNGREVTVATQPIAPAWQWGGVTMGYRKSVGGGSYGRRADGPDTFAGNFRAGRSGPNRGILGPSAGLA